MGENNAPTALKGCGVTNAYDPSDASIHYPFEPDIELSFVYLMKQPSVKRLSFSLIINKYVSIQNIYDKRLSPLADLSWLCLLMM